MANITFPQTASGIILFCRRYALCRRIAAVELEFRRFYFSVTGFVLRMLFQVEIFCVLRLAVGCRLGIFQLQLSPGDRMVRSVSHCPGTGVVAGIFCRTATVVEKFHFVPSKISALDCRKKSGILFAFTPLVPDDIFHRFRCGAVHSN